MREKVKGSLPDLVHRALLEAQEKQHVKYSTRATANFVAKKLGSAYVKTRAGWKRKIPVSREKVVLGEGRLAPSLFWVGVTAPEARRIKEIGKPTRNVISQQLQGLTWPLRLKNARVRLVAEVLP